tara:strand:+ start:195 stop:782 length:588 start_codon:yes stop_codon:yes gene_type:complete
MTRRELDIAEVVEWPLGFQLLFILLLVIALQLLGYWGYVTPKYNLESQVEDQLRTIKQSRNSNQDKIVKLVEVEAQYQQAIEREKKLSDPLMPPQDVTALLAKVAELVGGHSLSLTRIELQPANEYRFLTRLPITIELSGLYFDISEFVTALAQLPQVIIIEQIHWQRSGEASSVLRLRMQAHLYQLAVEKRDES